MLCVGCAKSLDSTQTYLRITTSPCLGPAHPTVGFHISRRLTTLVTAVAAMERLLGVR